MHQSVFGNHPCTPRAGATPWYDDKAQVIFALRDLESLSTLLSTRRHAGYVRKERLNEFYLFGGRWHLDTCGNATRAMKDPLPANLRTLLPLATKEEFWKFYNSARSIGAVTEEYISYSMQDRIPPARIHCPHCGKKWSIETAYDAVECTNTVTIPLSNFVGRTIADVKEHYARQHDAVYLMSPDIMIRNDKYIDLSLKYPGSEKDWEKRVRKNEHGWLGERDGVTDLHVVTVGDEAFFHTFEYFHIACRHAHITAQTEAQFREILRNAGYPKDTMLLPTENLYGSTEYRGPWFLAYYQDECIRIGWRKRVIEIDWSKVRSASLRTAIAEQFANVDSTHTDTVVHAYDPETASKFLSDIRRKLKKSGIAEVLED